MRCLMLGLSGILLMRSIDKLDNFTAILTFNLLDSGTSKQNMRDVGEGKEVNHERCPRSKLQLQCIRYLGSVNLMSLLYAP